MMTNLIVTADDFGLSDKINNGIIKCFKEGIVTSTAILINAPYTDQAINLAKENPKLEVGLHLSLVEGFSLSKKTSIIDSIKYFGENICLHRSWKKFLINYMLNKISMEDLAIELEMQMIKFLKNFNNIPFLNTTQHLHLLPKVNEIIIKLCEKYRISKIRLPLKSYYYTKNVRQIYFLILKQLAKKFRQKNIKVISTDYFVGFQEVGSLNEKKLIRIINNLPLGNIELMVYPGYEDISLKKNLPWAYSSFNWEEELNAICSEKINKLIKEKKVNLIQFKNL